MWKIIGLILLTILSVTMIIMACYYSFHENYAHASFDLIVGIWLKFEVQEEKKSFDEILQKYSG